MSKKISILDQKSLLFGPYVATAQAFPLLDVEAYLSRRQQYVNMEYVWLLDKVDQQILHPLSIVVDTKSILFHLLNNSIDLIYGKYASKSTFLVSNELVGIKNVHDKSVLARKVAQISSAFKGKAEVGVKFTDSKEVLFTFMPR
jgi:hypothetical protein